MEERVLGLTGERISVIGFGGIVVKNEEKATAQRYVGEVVERGVTYFDVAPFYGDAEERLGEALPPYRSRVFLACKTLCRTSEEATDELHRSLKKLRTDYFDLYQLHMVRHKDEVDRVTAPGGALEAVLQARQEGEIRFIGFSAHTEEAALALLDHYRFDTMLFPINWACWYAGDFGPRACEKAGSQGAAVLAIKALAYRKLKEGEEKPWPRLWYVPAEDRELPSLALRFTLSRATATVSPGQAHLLWRACEVVEEGVGPLAADEEEALKGRAERLRAEGLEPVFPREAYER